jgi:propanol-preferring alcohol dehydrogenase
MKAALFHGRGEPLSIEDVDVPVIGLRDVLVRVKACGVCHTDLHFARAGQNTSNTRA